MIYTIVHCNDNHFDYRQMFLKTRSATCQICWTCSVAPVVQGFKIFQWYFIRFQFVLLRIIKHFYNAKLVSQLDHAILAWLLKRFAWISVKLQLSLKVSLVIITGFQNHRHLWCKQLTTLHIIRQLLTGLCHNIIMTMNIC